MTAADILALECNAARDNGHDWEPVYYGVVNEDVVRYKCRRCGARKGEIAGVRCWYVGPQRTEISETTETVISEITERK